MQLYQKQTNKKLFILKMLEFVIVFQVLCLTKVYTFLDLSLASFLHFSLISATVYYFL